MRSTRSTRASACEIQDGGAAAHVDLGVGVRRWIFPGRRSRADMAVRWFLCRGSADARFVCTVRCYAVPTGAGVAGLVGGTCEGQAHSLSDILLLGLTVMVCMEVRYGTHAARSCVV